MAATQGHTQSLHTNSFDEALALPTDFSARIARNTQLFLQQESGTTRVIDPWGGSYYVERLTADLAAAPGNTSGRSRRSAHGPRHRRRRPEDAHRGGRRAHAGPHRFGPADHRRPEQVPARKEGTGRSAQGRQLGRARGANRTPERAARPPRPAQGSRDAEALTKCAQTGDGNLLELAVAAARAHATVGEISAALERIWAATRPPSAPSRGLQQRNGRRLEDDPAGARRRRRLRAPRRRRRAS